MAFSKSRNWDFPPELEFLDGTKIETISETKLVGVIVSNDLKWNKNTLYICNKARQRLWILRRLVKFNLNKFELFDVYTKEIRSVLELAVPVWHPGLTVNQKKSIESIQKLAFKIILKGQYTSYHQACKFFSVQTLEEKRENLCLKFALKNFKSENNMFTKFEPRVKTRNTKNIVIEPKCNIKK